MLQRCALGATGTAQCCNLRHGTQPSNTATCNPQLNWHHSTAAATTAVTQTALDQSRLHDSVGEPAAQQRPLPLSGPCRCRAGSAACVRPRGARLLSPVTASHRVAAPLWLAAVWWCCHCCICCADATCCVATGRAVATRYAVPMHCSMGWPCRVRARCNASMRSARASCATVRLVSLCVSLRACVLAPRAGVPLCVRRVCRYVCVHAPAATVGACRRSADRTDRYVNGPIC